MKKSILVVEDERIVAKDLQRSLGALGYEVTMTAASSDEALRYAAERRPDLALMDIRIRGDVDGIETARLLRERHDVPVVYLTAYVDDTTVSRAKATEPYGYLVKPLKNDELRSTIEIALYRHETERRLRQRERWFSTTLRSIGDAVLSTDENGLVTFMNREAEVLSGWHHEEARGSPFTEVIRLVDPKTMHERSNPIARALESRSVVQIIDATLLPKDKPPRIISNSAAPILDDTGQLLGAVLVFRDISEQRELQRGLELNSRLAAIGTLAAGVAHEINNPLTFLLSNTQFSLEALRHIPVEPTYQGQTDEIVSALVESISGIERIRDIVAGLRDFSRPGTGLPSRVFLPDLVKKIIAMTEKELSNKARILMQHEPSPEVFADEARLGQVLVNLLLNAAQAIPEGESQSHRITVHTGTDPAGRAFFAVQDTGSGMPPEVAARVFDPFFSTKGPSQGTGLGLSVCRGIVLSLGGEIQIESQLGAGSVLRVLLPAAPSLASNTSPGPVPENTRPGRVLLIDDQPDLCSVLERFLSSRFNMTSTTDAGQALEMIASGARFDLILCDLVMHGVSGIDFYERLLMSHPGLARRILFMTGGAFTTRDTDFLRLIENPVIEKPVLPQSLSERISTLLREWGTYQEEDHSPA